MPCYNPTRVVQNGDRRVQWNKDWRWAQYLDGETRLNIPCRSCIGCNQASAREWSVRGYHEAKSHNHDVTDPITRITDEIPNSCVVTLTYNPDHLPEDGLLDKKALRGFLQRLRNLRIAEHKKRTPNTPYKNIRFFGCGEYGGKTSRPHFHIVLHGESFSDRYNLHSGDLQKLEGSYTLDKLWSKKLSPSEPKTNMGRATVDSFTFAGAAYVSGYVAKKLNSLDGWKHQGPIREETDPSGVTTFKPISPEFRAMSNHPGLGHDWITRRVNWHHVYKYDQVAISEWKFHPPKYYDQVFERNYPDLMHDVRENRRDGQHEYAEEWGHDRCTSAEQIALTQLQLRRDSL